MIMPTDDAHASHRLIYPWNSRYLHDRYSAQELGYDGVVITGCAL